jgi:BirA family biotin operon repressor/biotin-[acetyl-CoA-carboxylase] ligase
MGKDEVLRLLMSSNSGYVSGAELAKLLTVSRTAVWKHIKTLLQEGHRIEAVPSKGYRLMNRPDVILLSELKQDLKTNLIGKDIRLYPETASTNTRAVELAREGAAEGTVIVAETQTGGKGRLGRSWISPKGNLYASVVLRPSVPPYKAPLLTLMGAVAAASAIRKHVDIQAGIKWPNDIFISGKKAGGLLTEMSAEPDRVKYVVLGIGLNVNMDPGALPAEIRDLSTSLSAEKKVPIDRTPLLLQLLQELDHWYGLFLRNEGNVLEAWKDLNVTTGKRVAVSLPGERLEGLAQGVDGEGRLILAVDDGTIRQVAAGDVTIVKGTDAETR